MTESEAHINDIADIFSRQPRIAAVRTFENLAVRYLLHLETEIYEIERLVLERSPRGVQSATTSSVNVSPVSDSIPAYEDVREKLKEYQELLLRVVEICRLKHLDHIDEKSLTSSLEYFLTKPCRPILEKRLDSLKENADFVRVLANHEPTPDWFTRRMIHLLFWLARSKAVNGFFESLAKCLRGALEKVLPKSCNSRIFNEESPKKPSEEEDFSTSNYDRLIKIVAVTNILIVSLLNAAALFTLNEIKNSKGRIGAIPAFSLLFSLAALVFASTDTAMIYTSTAAYSAVLVVFISIS
ncbi:hypothetical protein BGW36DRAFT_57869 [Talaromyces proteolyticus]|uniref:DUF6594 domain-containing protein n=1 Tax=Talaromyces proteolyticus TaxID=1131652 RepID=A0AAD4PVQ0_9EURO|nr:uncharacterized protein BGW36DRAFT_57869 [Talaromyces proteolyticus]KAH8690595.1 hypothetical protein BGW36DRAFT_57869 [Talaromyces proteolyticus]